jgi:hypothetical protein
VLPRRWIVERTFAWLGKYRRLSKDYEALTETSEALIYALMVHVWSAVWLVSMRVALSEIFRHFLSHIGSTIASVVLSSCLNEDKICGGYALPTRSVPLTCHHVALNSLAGHRRRGSKAVAAQ